MNEPWWGHTKRATESGVVGDRMNGEVRYRKSRPTIGRDARLEGGVFEGSYLRESESIVVDWGGSLQEAYDKIEVGLEKKTTDSDVLDHVFKYVESHMKYDEEAVNSIFTEKAGGVDHQKVDLEVYIDEAVGICRHQALFVGALLEHFIDNSILTGAVSVDRNSIKQKGSDKYDSHAWVRYTDVEGQVYILDVAQHKMDTLKSLRQKREEGETMWNYARPEDLRSQLGRSALPEEKIGRAENKVELRKGGKDRVELLGVNHGNLPPGEVSKIATIFLGDSKLQIFDIREATPRRLPDGRQVLDLQEKIVFYPEDTVFMVVGKKTEQAMQIREGDSVMIGRGKTEDQKTAAGHLGLSGDMQISREHLLLEVNDAGNLVIRDVSTNGTTVEGQFSVAT